MEQQVSTMDVYRIYQLMFLVLINIIDLSYATDTQSYLRTTIEQKFAENRHHLTLPDYKNAAKEFIKQEFEKFGLETIEQDFPGTLTNPELTGYTFTNVIGIWRGSNFGKMTDKIVGIGAHYDTRRDANGVDDNGSGVAAMLAAASMLKTKYRDPTNTIIFIAFDIEEYLHYPDIGSQSFIEKWLYKWLKDNYGSAYRELQRYGIIILDTVMNFDETQNSQGIPGDDNNLFQLAFPDAYNSMHSDTFQGDFLALIYRDGEDDSPLATSMKEAWTSYGSPEHEIELFKLPDASVDTLKVTYKDFLRSDHRNFWKEDIPAIFITDSADLRGKMKKCYHTECDNVETMLTDGNVRFLQKIAESMATTIGKLSGATEISSGGNGGSSGGTSDGTSDTVKLTATLSTLILTLSVSFL